MPSTRLTPQRDKRFRRKASWLEGPDGLGCGRLSRGEPRLRRGIDLSGEQKLLRQIMCVAGADIVSFLVGNALPRLGCGLSAFPLLVSRFAILTRGLPNVLPQQLIQPVNVGKPDAKFGTYLLEQFGGATGELTAALQHWVQSFHVENAAIRDMLQDGWPFSFCNRQQQLCLALDALLSFLWGCDRCSRLWGCIRFCIFGDAAAQRVHQANDIGRGNERLDLRRRQALSFLFEQLNHGLFVPIDEFGRVECSASVSISGAIFTSGMSWK